jgi:urease accessory protein
MRACVVLVAGRWDPQCQIDIVRLDFDARHRRRISLVTEGGREFLLDLPRTMRLRDGDGLVLEDGAIVRVRAEPEPLLEIRAHDAGALVRIAWHLGNRHLPVQLYRDRIRIRADHVIAEMIVGLGGEAEALEAPFEPEAGAYAGANHHHDDDDHAH